MQMKKPCCCYKTFNDMSKRQQNVFQKIQFIFEKNSWYACKIKLYDADD
jgi:hypothetical protein